jgi:hypothetical protein
MELKFDALMFGQKVGSGGAEIAYHLQHKLGLPTEQRLTYHTTGWPGLIDAEPAIPVSVPHIRNNVQLFRVKPERFPNSSRER